MAELRRKLSAIARRLARRTELRVGFMGGATYPDGPQVAAVAAINEFGSVMHVPERMTVTYRSLRADGTFNKQGRFVKKRASNFATNHMVPAHTVVIPARPFMRPTITANQQQWYRDFATLLRQPNTRPEVALRQMGEKIVVDIQTTIRSVTEPPNAPSTIRAKKGRDKPLEDAGQMLRAVTYEVRR